MNRKKKIFISIVCVVLLIVILATATYAYILAMTEEKTVSNGSGKLDINYTAPSDITGNLTPSMDRSGGLFTSASAKLNTGSQLAAFNMYLTPTVLTNLNIPALKWEAEGIRNGQIICSDNGDFSTAQVDERIKILSDCALDFTETVFNIYIWLDINLVSTSLAGASFDAKIGADSLPVTGLFNQLPQEYQRVEYIESTGTQHIEIDYIASNVTNSKGTYQIMNTDNARMLFGSRTNVYTNVYSFNWGGSSPWRYYNAYYDGTVATSKTIDLNKHTFEKKGINLYIDGVLVNSRTDVTDTFKTPYKMIVFGCNTNGTIGLQSEARIFELKFYDDNILKIDLVPCYRKTDNVIGMYDVVGNKFYTNSGTGEFLKGIDVSSK